MGQTNLNSILNGLPSSDAEINDLIQSGKVNLVKDQLEEQQLITTLIKIFQQLTTEKTKVISLIGGAASGKTTLVNHLLKQLSRADSISPDDFLIHDTAWRRANIVAQGRPAVEKYAPEIMKEYVQKIRHLAQGETIKIPRLNYATGVALAAGKENFPHLITGQLQYLIIDGDFHFIQDSDLVIYFHVPDLVRNQNRLQRETKEKLGTNLQKLYQDMRLRHLQQQLVYTLPVAKMADWLIVVAVHHRYHYNLYNKNTNF